MKKVYSFDTEVYTNYFLVKFQNVETKQIKYVEMFEGVIKQDLPVDLKTFLFNKNNTFISFNGINFDELIIASFLRGHTNEQIKKVCDFIISKGAKHWITRKQFKLPELKFDHIDLQEPAHGVGVSLKGYMGRMACKLMQDLPIEPDTVLTRKQANEISTYCDNDLVGTSTLYTQLLGEIQLRESIKKEYDTQDLRSKGGAQVATTVLAHSLEVAGASANKRTSPVKPFKYVPPKWVHFDDPVLNEVLSNMTSATFEAKDTGHIKPPPELKKSYTFNGLKFQPSIGGLHSKEKCFAFTPNSDQFYGEADCQSFYPKVIIEEGYTPSHLDRDKFLKAYKGLLDGRVADKTRMYEIKKEIAELERSLDE